MQTSPRLVGGRLVADARRGLWHLRHGGVEGLRTWSRRRSAEQRPTVAASVGPGGSVSFGPWPTADRPVARPGLRVAVVLDDFSRAALAPEWDQVEVLPSSWQQTLEQQPVDLLFVESAWAGNGGAWRYHLTGTSAPRPALVELVAWCRAHGVPTVFWNKEDPAHLEDFLATAALFDHVLTTDSDVVPRYVAELGHDRVGVLGFAAQPSLHHPARAVGHQERDVAFAGMYFAHRYPERREQMDLLLGAALRAGRRMPTGLEIFSRQLGGRPEYQFPEPLAGRVVGSLTYAQTLSAYRAYKVFLNVNSVVGSPSMCARRVFEITASGTPVVSTPSEAVRRTFDPTEVHQVATAEEAEHTVRALVRSHELRDRTVHLAQRRIWREHTYSHRVHAVLDAVGLVDPAPPRVPPVSALVSTARPHRLEHVLRTVASQLDVEVELALLVHGDGPDEATVRAQAAAHGLDHVVVLSAGRDVPLGTCLDRLVRAASGEVVAKMDDDDLYGPRYLSDQVAALGWSGADVVGKQAHYLHLGSVDVTVLRAASREHRWTDLVAGPTIVARRSTALATPFPPLPRGEDTGFLRAVGLAGGRVYSADRFGFVQQRHAHGHGHTWDVTDAELLASGDVLAFGSCHDHVMI